MNNSKMVDKPVGNLAANHYHILPMSCAVRGAKADLLPELLRLPLLKLGRNPASLYTSMWHITSQILVETILYVVLPEGAHPIPNSLCIHHISS